MGLRHSLYCLLFVALPGLAAIPECSLVFPDGAQTHASNGVIRFDWDSRITSNGDRVLETSRIDDYSGGVSCNSGPCSASGGASTAINYGNIPNSNTALTTQYNANQLAVAGKYSQINLASNSILTLSAGDYLISGDVYLGSSSKLRTDGAGIVRLIVKGNVWLEHASSINDSESEDKILIYSQGSVTLTSSARAYGFVYAHGDAHLHNEARVTGAVAARNINMGSSRSRITYKKDLVSGLTFGDLCGGAPAQTGGGGSSANSCEAIFSDGVQSHHPAGAVNLYWSSRITGSPDSILDTPRLNDSSGGRSCGSLSCGLSGSPANAISFNNYSNGGSNVSLGWPERTRYRNGYRLAAGTYRNITLGYDTHLVLEGGDYYISGDLSVGTQAQISLEGAARLFIRGSLSSDHRAQINSSGSAESLLVIAKQGLTIGNEVAAKGFFYSEKDAIVYNRGQVTGALSGKDVYMNSSYSEVVFDAAALSNSDFGDICGGSGGMGLAPVAEYRFDDCSLTSSAEDSTGNHSNARIFGAEQSNGVIHGALDLTANASSDGAQLPSSVFHGLNDFTLGMWVKTSTNKQQQELLHVLGSHTSDDELELYLYYNSYVVVNVGDRVEFLRTSRRINDGNWHQVVLTRQSDTVCLFVDGQKQRCERGVGSSTLSVPVANAAYLGQEQDSFGGSFDSRQGLDGELDEFKVFDKLLSDSEISDLYQQEANGQQADGSPRPAPSCSVSLPSARWDFGFDEASWAGTGNEVTDFAGGNDGQARGGVNTGPEGQVCRLASLDGYDDYINVDGLSTVLNNTASVAYWIKTTQQGTAQTWTSPLLTGVEQNGGIDDIFWGRIDEGGRVGVSVGNDTSTRSNGVINDGEWHYVVISRDADNGDYQVFIDGALDKSGSIERGEIGPSYSSIGRAQIAYGSGATGYLNADIDELAIFDQVLTEGQVSLMYNNQLNDMRWNGEEAACVAVPQVDHYRIQTDSPTLTCDEATITVTAYDINGQVVNPGPNTTVTVSFSGALDSVTLGSGSGSWQAGSRQYQFADGESSFTLKASRSTPTLQDIDIDVSDGLAQDPDDGGANDQRLRFVGTAFKFYADGVESAIGPQMAGKLSNEGPGSQNVILKAISADPNTGVCSALVSGALNVGFSYGCDDPATCALPTGAVSVNNVDINQGTLADTTGIVSVPLVFNAQGEAPVSFSYKDTGSISLYVESLVSGVTGLAGATSLVQGESNSFVVKPGGLCLTATGAGDSQCASLDGSCSAFVPAGSNFNLSMTSRLWNNGASVCGQDITPSFNLTGIGLSLTKVAPTAGQAGTLAVSSFDASNGEAQTSSQQVNEVGVYRLTATPPAYQGEALDPVSTDIGRFYASHFTLDSAASDVNGACGPTPGFTYFGRPFDTSYRLQARNAQGQIVQNYRDDFIKLSRTQGNLDFSAWSGSDLSSRLSGTSGSFADSSSYSWSAGEVDITTAMVFARAASPDGPYDAMTIGLLATDADGAGFQNASKDLDLNGDATNDSVSMGQTTQRYGRMNLANTHGPETSDLNQPFQAEYYNGSRFVRNDLDVCTTVGIGNFGYRFVDDDTAPDDSFSLITGSLNAVTIDGGSSTPSIAVGTLDAGQGRFEYTAPGRGNTGTLYTRILPDSWLTYDWDGDGAYTDAPEASVTFGRFRGHDRLIHWIEGE
ncbi:MAG: DUF6701 domain-containing protein [Pontibacterium sp.]